MSQLAIYLANHLAGARGGMHLFWRAVRHNRGTARGDALARISREVEEDLDQLRGLMKELGVEENKLLSGSAAIAVHAGRLKPNGHLLRRSPLAALIEVESLRDAVYAKHSGWEALLSASQTDERLPRGRLLDLRARAEDQMRELGEIHAAVAAEVFTDV